MNNETNKLIPEIRFPEFYNEAGWEDKKFGNTISIIIDNRGKTPPIENKGIPLLEVNSIGEKEIKYDLVTKFVSEFTFDDWFRKHLSDGDVLFSTVGRTALCSYYDGKIKAAIAQNIVGFRFKEENGLFMYYLLSEENNFIKMKAIEMGAVQPSIKVTQLTELYFNFPKPTEQKKIADFLSSLDKVITAQTDKLETLKTYKKGMMQNLFPQEGEKAPKIRFKEFEKDGDWIESTFGNTATFINGKAYKQEELLEKGKYKVLRVGNFFTSNNWYYSNLELDEDKYCENGDLLYAWSASFGPKIWDGDKTIYHYHIWKVVEKEGIDKNYLYKLLDFETVRMKTQNANGFGLLHITKGTIESWKCFFPSSIKEQQKIADTLSSLDELIKEQSNKIEELKLHKKGLMQGLFPKVKN